MTIFGFAVIRFASFVACTYAKASVHKVAPSFIVILLNDYRMTIE